MKKIFYTLFIFLALLISSYFLYFLPSTKELSNKIYLEKSGKMKQLFKEEVSKKYGRTDALTYILSKDEKITKALLNNDKSILNYEDTLK